MDLNLSTEEKLLLALSNLTFNDQQKSEINKLVSDDLAWSDFIKLANDHGISALVYNNLKELELMDKVPEKEVVFLQGAYLKSLSRNTILLEKFLELQSILEEAGITPVLIKGMALELTAWGNMGLRQMNDIDLYVEPEKALDAWKLLRTKGYKSDPPKSNLHNKAVFYTGKHLPELHKDGISFEIHHKLFNIPHPTPYTLYPVPDNNQDCNIPSVNIHFLYLIKHLAYHENKGEAQIRQYIDLCQLMTQCTHDIKSSGILELAKEYGLLEILLGKLYQLYIFWDVSLPEDILQQIGNKQKQESINIFLKFLKQPKGHIGPCYHREYLKTFKNIPGFGNKFRYEVGNIFPSLNYMKWYYNTKNHFTAFFYYPIRLVTIISRFINS